MQIKSHDQKHNNCSISGKYCKRSTKVCQYLSICMKNVNTGVGVQQCSVHNKISLFQLISVILEVYRELIILDILRCISN